MPKSTSTDLPAAGIAGDAGSAALRRAYDDPVMRAARGSLTAQAAEAAGIGTLASRAADAVKAATIGIGGYPGSDSTVLTTHAISVAAHAADVAKSSIIGSRALDAVNDRHFRDAVTAATSAIGTVRTDVLATSARALSAGVADQIATNFDARYRLADHLGEAVKVGTLAKQAMVGSKAITDQLHLLTGRPLGYGIDDAALSDLARVKPQAPTGYESPMRDLLDQIAGTSRPAGQAPRLQKPGRTTPQKSSPSASLTPSIAKGAPIMSVADIGKCVREARKAMDMTQQHFADLAGVGRRFLIELEQGKPSLEIDRVLLVCHAAGIKLGFLA